MGRNPKRASGVKALQAIRGNGQPSRAKKNPDNLENAQPGLKRSSSPTSLSFPNAKRTALGNVTNNPISQHPMKPLKATTIAVATIKSQTTFVNRTKQPDTVHRLTDLNESVEASQSSSLSGSTEATPVTSVQQYLQAASLSDDSLRSEESLSEDIELPTPPPAGSSTSSPGGQLWKDIDQAEAQDPLFSAEYSPDIFVYMRKREEFFSVEPYMSHQPDITAAMRTILVDWLIEVQENFELFHETLYLAVKLADLYLMKREVKREYLQLVGATCMLIAAKFEELSPPLVDDFLYLCDDAYTHEELLRMEREVLHTLNYDVNVPVAYRFVRRLARAAEATMETHTLARYISESTLQDYRFVDVRPSLIAASAMYLALRMKKLGPWTPTLQHYSCYTVEEMLPTVERLNTLIQAPTGANTTTVRSKYSHEVFFKVALTPALQDVAQDARQALLESPSQTITV